MEAPQPEERPSRKRVRVGAAMTEPQAIAAVLADLGVTKRRDQATLLGLGPDAWSRYRAGRSPQGSTLRRWLVRLGAAGHPVRLVCDGDAGWTCEVRNGRSGGGG